MSSRFFKLTNVWLLNHEKLHCYLYIYHRPETWMSCLIHRTRACTEEKLKSCLMGLIHRFCRVYEPVWCPSSSATCGPDSTIQQESWVGVGGSNWPSVSKSEVWTRCETRMTWAKLPILRSGKLVKHYINLYWFYDILVIVLIKFGLLPPLTLLKFLPSLIREK